MSENPPSASSEPTLPPQGDSSLSRRRVAAALVLGVPAAVVATAAHAEAAPSGTTAAGPWTLAGNVGTTSANFLGTTDGNPLVIRTDNLERLRINANGSMAAGAPVVTAQLSVRSQIAATPAINGENSTQGTDSVGVQGRITNSHSGVQATGVLGSNANPGAAGYGVRGTHAGTGYGVSGTTAKAGIGGIFSSAGGTGVMATGGSAGTGLKAVTTSGTGVQGVSTSGVGVLGTANDDAGLAGSFTNVSTGTGLSRTGIRSLSGLGTAAVIHPSTAFFNAAGEFSGPNGVIGAASADSPSGYGLIGLATGSSGYGIYASNTASGGLAGYFLGNVGVSGTLSKGGGSFKIDHPLDPENKYLYHSFVESPDMKNIYDGVVTLDATGRATVTMPDWFDALNREFRYQLTALGSAAPELHIAAELRNRTFTVAGGRAGQRVSWQVTGVRQDAFAKAHRIPVEQDKPARERGRYLHPEAFGLTAERGSDPAMLRQLTPGAAHS